MKKSKFHYKVYHSTFQKMIISLWFILYLKVKAAQSCLTFCDPMDYTVQEILQARILEWVAFPFSCGSSQPKNQTGVSCIAGGFFTSWATNTEKCLKGCTLDSWQWPLQGVELSREEELCVVSACMQVELLQSCPTDSRYFWLCGQQLNDGIVAPKQS